MKAGCDQHHFVDVRKIAIGARHHRRHLADHRIKLQRIQRTCRRSGAPPVCRRDALRRPQQLAEFVSGQSTRAKAAHQPPLANALLERDIAVVAGLSELQPLRFVEHFIPLLASLMGSPRFVLALEVALAAAPSTLTQGLAACERFP